MYFTTTTFLGSALRYWTARAVGCSPRINIRIVDVCALLRYDQNGWVHVGCFENSVGHYHLAICSSSRNSCCEALSYKLIQCIHHGTISQCTSLIGTNGPICRSVATSVPRGPMLTHSALAGSVFAGLSDELIAYFTLFFEPLDLLQLSRVNSGNSLVHVGQQPARRVPHSSVYCCWSAVFYVFCQEDPLWMAQCLRVHNGNFYFYHNWKLTTFYPRDPRPLAQLDKAFRPVVVRNFSSDFLYRRWCRCHMELGDAFQLRSEGQDPTIRRLQKIDVQDLTFRDFYECVLTLQRQCLLTRQVDDVSSCLCILS